MDLHARFVAATQRHGEMTNESRDTLRRVVAELDAEWFDGNPGYLERYRELIPGEFDSEDAVALAIPAESLVVVTRGYKALLPWSPISA